METQTDIQSEIEGLKLGIPNAQTPEEKQEMQDTLDMLEKQVAEGKTETTEIIEPEIQPIVEKDKDIPEPEIIESEPIPDLQDANVFSNNNFYLKNTDKTLGTIKIEKDRFGKEIEIVQGNFEDLQKVNLDYNFLHDDNITDSAIKDINIQPNINSADIVIEKSEKTIIKKFLNKKSKKEELEGLPADEILTFEEVYKKYNPDISLDELKVFIWYKEQIGQPLNIKWYKLAELEYIIGTNAKNFTNEWLIEKVKEGLIYYFDGNLLPKYLYLAENIYEKYIALVEQGEKIKAGWDAKHIIENYGQEVYDKQVAKLNEVYTTLYNSRLLVGDSSVSNALKLVPFSDFAKNFTIKTLIDEKPFIVKYYGTKNKLNEIDFFYNGSKWNKEEVNGLSLKDAFCYWLCIDYNNITFKKGVSYADIIKIYVNQTQRPRKPSDDITDAQWKDEWERKKEKVRLEGERIFNIFLVEKIKLEDKVAIESSWNKSYNNYVPINYNKIPVALTINKNFEIKPEKRDAIAFLFNQGSGCLAYEVGIGKTPAASFIIKQYIDSGYSNSPLIVVPNQTYRQWISELKKFIPSVKINDFYNLRGDYYEELLDEKMNVSKVADGSISVITYEGFEMLGFNEQTEAKIFDELYEMLNQGGVEENIQEKKKEAFYQKLRYLIGRGLKGTVINIEDIGVDFICFDEAHVLKKIFTSVKGETEKGGTKRGKTPYKINSGVPSGIGLKGFMIAQYVLRNNNYRNILLLTATPFTNSPLEIFSMLALVAYKRLQETDLNNINNFFDNYIEIENQLVVTATMKAEYRQVVTGWKNIDSLQKLIKRFFDFKDASNTKGITELRPNKIVLPLINKNIDGNIIKLNENERIETYIQLSGLQESLMEDIIKYATGDLDENDLLKNARGYEIEDTEVDISEDDTKAVLTELNESAMGDEEKKNVRTIKSIMYSQSLALSPYLYRFSGLRQPTYLEYVNTSPKLKYVMECIKSVKQYHEKHNEEISGQIIYMNRGIQYFNLLKQYLVEVVGYKQHEVGLVFSQMKGGNEAKDDIKNLFLGIKYNKETMSFEKIPNEQRMKILIGSGTIKEGMNLQMKSTVLYNCFLDWNPTDIIQLHGRLWRQGNEFKNVRICNPLMVNSVDVFLFQKLEDKTKLINAIWNTDNKTSVLKLEEFNPSELKFALIRDPEVFAKYQIEEETTKIEDKIASEKSLKKKFELFTENLSTLDHYRKKIDDILTIYRPKKFKPELSDNDKIKMFIELLRTQTDENGLKMVKRYDREYYIEKGIKISPKDGLDKEYWYHDVVFANRTIELEKKDYFKPLNLHVEHLKEYIYEQNQKLDELDLELKSVNSKEHVAELVEQNIEQKEKEKIKERTIPELVEQFANLNNLLSIKFGEKEIAEVQAEEFNCISDDAKEIKIDENSIDKLEECTSKLPTTKSQNITSDGEYTEERKALHKKIYEKYASKKVCVNNRQPIAILTGGSPASGKTSFFKKYASFFTSDNIYKIDADEIRMELPEYKGWNSSATHDETRDIIRQYLLSDENIGQPCKFDLLYDGTMNKTKNYLPLIAILKKLGYKIFIIYMNKIPYKEAIKRSLHRFKEGDQFGIHRYTPRSIIKEFYSNGKVALDELKTKVDGYIIVDASNRKYNIIETGGIALPRFDFSDKEKVEIKIKEAETKRIKEKVDKQKAEAESKFTTIAEYQSIIDIYKEMLSETKNKTAKKEYKSIIEIYTEMAKELEKEAFEFGGNIDTKMAEGWKNYTIKKWDEIIVSDIVYTYSSWAYVINKTDDKITMLHFWKYGINNDIGRFKETTLSEAWFNQYSAIEKDKDIYRIGNKSDIEKIVKSSKWLNDSDFFSDNRDKIALVKKYKDYPEIKYIYQDIKRNGKITLLNEKEVESILGTELSTYESGGSMEGGGKIDEFLKWKENLITLISKESGLEISEIALTETELIKFYNQGLTPTQVYFEEFAQDVGHFYKIPFAEGGKLWIQKAIKHKGILRKKAKEMGLLKGDEKLSETDLKKLETLGGVWAKRVNLARTMKKFEGGGNIPDNYKSKTPKQVWNSWTEEQRKHFMSDHRNNFVGLKISRDVKSMWENYSIKQGITSSFENLPAGIKSELAVHIIQGQYKKGGEIEEKILVGGGKIGICPIGMKVQTILFPVGKWNVVKSKKWLKKHNYKHGKADKTENFYRFRQITPNKFKKDSFRTIEFGKSGIKSVVACPKK